MATAVSERDRQRVRERLLADFPYYSANCLKIVDAGSRIVPFLLKPGQLKLWDALVAQRESGEPMRAIVLKARKIGFSTMVQGLMIQRATQLQNHRAQVVAHDNDTAGAIFDIGKFMWANLPAQIQPRLQAERNSKGGVKFVAFGEPSVMRRREGFFGLNSTIEIDTAKEVAAGRGLTIHSLHLSEVAFWGDATSKKIALLNAVPDDPMTLVVEESTANGNNEFKDAWERAEAGDSAYAAVFASWWEEEAYSRPFVSVDARAEFVEQIGTGPYGEDEPSLVEMGCVPEQLAWRRWTIINKCEGLVEQFHREYPSTPEEAFETTGRQVFAKEHIAKARRAVRLSDPVVPAKGQHGPTLGILTSTASRSARGRGSTVLQVPTAVEFQPRESLKDPTWRIWSPPAPERHVDGKLVPAGQYVVACDPMSGDERQSGGLAWHGVQVLDHRTREQVAEYRSRVDPDELGEELLKAAILYNRAVIVVEITGGWGLPLVRQLALDFKWPFMYTRQPSFDQRVEHYLDRLGWSTTRPSKELLIAGAKVLLREGTHGIRSRLLVGELGTYVKDERGRTLPEPGKNSDLLMAWLIGQQVAHEKPVRPSNSRPTSTWTRTVTNEATGW